MVFFALATQLAIAGEPLPEEALSSISHEGIEPALASALWDDLDDSDVEIERTTVAFAVKPGFYATISPTSSAKIRSLTRPEWMLPAKVVLRTPDVGLCLIKVDASPTREEILRLDTRLKAPPGGGLFSGPVDGEFAPGVLAGRDRIYQGETLPFTLYRVRLDGSGPSIRVAGTPIFNELGSVIAVQTGRKLESEADFHGIPAALVAKMLGDYDGPRIFSPVRIGAKFKRTATIPEIIEILPDSPADQAGLRTGDIVLKAADESITELADLIDILRAGVAGRPIEVEILRGLETLSIELIPERRETS